MAGRIVVITGSTSGIGKACAELFESMGDTVCHLSLSNRENVDNFYTCDVSREDEVIEAFRNIANDHGHIDILLNNAGYGVSGVTELIPIENAHKLFDVNFFGVLACTKYALPLMSRGSKILNISSACALFPLPFRTLYCASKSAVHMLSLSQRLELKDAGIEVCSLCLGDTKTNFTKNREKHFDTNKRYGDRPNIAAERIDSKNDKRMSVEYVAKRIVKIAGKKHIPAMKIIGKKYEALYFAKRLVPNRTFMYFDDKFMGGH